MTNGNQEHRRELLDSNDGENRALRQLLNAMSVQSYENFRATLEGSGYDYCIPDWAQDRKGYITTGDVQRWIRYILALETPTEATRTGKEAA